MMNLSGITHSLKPICHLFDNGSRQFKNFDEYLVPVEKFTTLKRSSELPLAVITDCDQYRASGLNLVTAAIVLWNTVYMDRAINALRSHGQSVEEEQLKYLSPLGWEHINLTGDYVWKSSAKVGTRKFRALRTFNVA